MPEKLHAINFVAAPDFSRSGIRPETAQTPGGGIEVVGADTPLDQGQLNSLIHTRNESFARGERPREENTLYATHFVRASEFNNPSLLDGTGYSDWESFLTAHYAKFGEIIKEADPDSLSGGVVLRDIVVIGDGVVAPASFHSGWLAEGLHDSNGSHGVWHPGEYRPAESAYWDEESRIDMAFVHEAGHRIAHLPDVYSLDFDATEIDHPALAGLPEDLRRYIVHHRNDRGPSLMANVSDRLDNYTKWLLSRRAEEGWVHQDERAIPEGGWFFPDEVAGENILGLGAEWRDAQARVYRTEGESDNKTLGEAPVFEGRTNERGDVSIGNPFETAEKHPYGSVYSTSEAEDVIVDEDGEELMLIPNHQANVVVEIVGEGGERAVAFYDIADFSLGVEKAEKHGGVVRLDRDPIDLSNPPAKEDYDWEIKYTGPMTSTVNLPFVSKRG